MSENSSTSASKRGVSLPRIQTSFNDNPHNRLQRPRPVEAIILERRKNAGPPHEVPPPLFRHQAKGGLFDFFGRGRSAIVQKANQTRDVGRPRKESIARQNAKIRSEPPQESHGDLPVSDIHTSRHDLNLPATSLQKHGSKSSRKLKSDRQEASTKNLGAWDPPELFKAYPQAVRHCRLRAPLLNVERLLQRYAETKNGSTKEDDHKSYPDQAGNNSEGRGLRTKVEKDKKAKCSVRDIWSNISWTEKIYVLATSGYLLQYSGSGSFDRVPERFLSLGKHSAAFVSDAIPGQHYVLQISRVAQEDGTIHSDLPRSIFKRLGFRKDARRCASNLLLVFDSPEDMNEWLVALRKEIESLGGRKYVPDVVRQTTEEDVKRVLEKPSRRYLIKRDPDRFADPGSNLDSGVGGDRNNRLSASHFTSRQACTVRTPSIVRQKSLDSPSLSYMTTSTDQLALEQLRGTPRLSYASAGAKTLSTSWSSPGPSPARAAFSPDELTTRPDGQEVLHGEFSPLDQWSMTKKSVTSSLTPPTLASCAVEPSTRRRISTHSISSEKTASWPPPNFNVPSFSKRYSYSTSASVTSGPSSHLLVDSQKKHTHATYIPHEKRINPQKYYWDEEPLSSGPDASKSTAIDLSTYSSPVERLVVPSTLGSTIPRRFSSPPASVRGDSPCRQPGIEATSPHPPPTTALPALPEQRLGRKSSRSVSEHQRPGRPASVQGRSHPDSWPRSLLPKIGLHDPSEVDEYTLASPSRTVALPRSPPRMPFVQPALQHPKSMPQLSTGLPAPSAADLSLLSDIPFFLQTASNAKDLFVGTRHACGVPDRQPQRVGGQ